MALVGYGRVSSTGQQLDIQLDQLRAAGCEKIFAEKRSGTTTDGRAELEACLEWVRENDVVCVTRLDRLARSMTDLQNIVTRLQAKNVGFKVLQQGGIDTTRPEGRLMLNLLGSFAEFETDLRRERQAEGIAKARAEGRYRGRPQSIKAEEILALESEGLGPTEIARRLGIGRASIYRLRAAAAPAER